MRSVTLTGAACAALAVLLLTLPPAARGEDLTFFPEVDWSEGSIEVGAATQNNVNTYNGKGSSTRDTILHESLNLAADGHVYHPRFMLFHARLWGGLTQQSGNGVTGYYTRSTMPSVNYELRTIFLPEHPYNLELFALHEESNIPGTFLRSPNGTYDEQGASFNYKDNPYFFHASYIASSTDFTTNRTDSKTYRLNGNYEGSVLADTAAYSHTDAVTSTGLQVMREDYALGNVARYARMVLSSRINESTMDQQQPLRPSFQTDTVTWTEQLNVDLPANLMAGAHFDYVSEVNQTGETAQTPEKQEFNRSTAASFNLSHRLYQSLVTDFSLNDSSVDSSSGEITNRSESLSSVYMKAIPLGRLTAGVSLSKTISDRTGSVVIINEVHKAALFTPFSLSLRDAVESTIVVQVKDPANGSLVLLPPSDYVVAHMGDITQITVISVAPLTPDPNPLFVYEFQAAYSLTDQSKTAFRSWGYSVKLDLIDNLLSVYFNYSTTNEELLSGSLAGGAGRETSETVGVTAQAASYSGLIEHQQFRSWQNPWEYWKTTGQYRAPLAEDAIGTVQFTYQLTDYFASQSVPGSVDYRDKRFEIDIMAEKRFPHQNLSLFLTTTFIRSRALIDADTILLNSYLTWQVGLLTVNGGVQLSSLMSNIAGSSTAEISQYYYVTVSRKLF